MKDVLSVKNMRESDAATIAGGIPGRELMMRAAKGVFEAVVWKPPVAIVCGSGNNAGDGYALALLLSEAGIDCTVFTTSDRFSEDGKYYYDKCKTDETGEQGETLGTVIFVSGETLGTVIFVSGETLGTVLFVSSPSEDRSDPELSRDETKRTVPRVSPKGEVCVAVGRVIGYVFIEPVRGNKIICFIGGGKLNFGNDKRFKGLGKYVELYCMSVIGNKDAFFAYDLSLGL